MGYALETLSAGCPELLVSLAVHPATPPLGIGNVSVRARWGGGTLQFCFRVDGCVEGLVLPVARPPERADGLWRHTCFEAFIDVPSGAGYTEYNFSPSAQWAVFDFLAYREAAAEPRHGPPPRLSGRLLPRAYELEAVIDAAWLPGGRSASEYGLGLSAVLEERGGRFSYWALRHGGVKPDFHRREGFLLRLKTTGQNS